jgi:hypothetical protein
MVKGKHSRGITVDRPGTATLTSLTLDSAMHGALMSSPPGIGFGVLLGYATQRHESPRQNAVNA